jgi:hypothetical protein
MPVAHGCNPSYTGGREQEDHGSKPPQANSLRDLPYFEKTHHTLKKKVCQVAQGEGPEFEAQYRK